MMTYTNHLLTIKRASSISVLADSSTDCSIKDLEHIYVRLLEVGKPRNTYLTVQELENCHSDGHLATIATGETKSV